MKYQDFLSQISCTTQFDDTADLKQDPTAAEDNFQQLRTTRLQRSNTAVLLPPVTLGIGVGVGVEQCEHTISRVRIAEMVNLTCSTPSGTDDAGFEHFFRIQRMNW